VVLDAGPPPAEETLRPARSQPAARRLASTTGCRRRCATAYHEIARMRRETSPTRCREYARIVGERSTIVDDQARVRSNMGAVPNNSQLFRHVHGAG